MTTIGGKSKTDLLFTLSCDRGAASQIDWNNVEGKGLRALCDYHAYVNGLPGYTGQTTPSGDTAGERQFQADIQAHGVPDSIATIPDLGDGACNSVQNGQAPGTWAMQMTNPPNNFTIMQSLVIVYWAVNDLCPNQMDKGVRDFWQNEIYDHPPGIEPSTPDTESPLEPGQ